MFKTLTLITAIFAASNCFAKGLGDDSPSNKQEDFQLIIVQLKQDQKTVVMTAQMPDIDTCKEAEAAAHDAAKWALDTIDVGTICVQSSFDLSIKPRV